MGNSLRVPKRLLYPIVAILGLLVPVLMPPYASARPVQAGPEPAASFELRDSPGNWFDSGANIAGTRSLAVVQPNSKVRFTVGSETNTVHTATSLVFPTGAHNMPFDQPSAFRGVREVTLKDPGLYVFVCKLHPFMLGSVIVDDPKTTGLDVSSSLSLVTGVTVPSSSDLATRLLRAFFVITNPSNWQNYDTNTNPTLTWHVTYPSVDIRIDVGVVNLKGVLEARYGNDLTLPSPFTPSTQGIGEVWVDTQFEETAGKTKPGTATKLDVTNWQVARKVGLPGINMNNPHNMWTDRDQEVIYQTQWFDNKLTVFDRQSGALVTNIEVGEAPAHVMTRVDTDQVHVSLNGEGAIIELSPRATGINRAIATQGPNELPGQPHAHWMSFDGQNMITPNSNTNDATLICITPGTIAAKPPVGFLPIAASMMPDASKYYVSNYLDSSISVIDPGSGTVIKTINLLANYNPITGAGFSQSGALPIQTPVSPNGKFVVTANTLTGTITIIATATDAVVKVLPCDAGCHGVNFGAKKGGGYYAYVSSKFSNGLTIVDPDPNNDGNASDAVIAGRIALVASANTHADDQITLYAGTGGQGVLPIPLAYNGWVQNLPDNWKAKLTAEQRNPFP